VPSNTTRTRLRATLAFATTAALIIGVPILLASLTGSPIPRTVPNLPRVRAFLTGTVSSGTLRDVLVHLLATVSWVAWTLLCLAFADETIAAIQHRSTRTIWRAGGMQHLARTLVATIAIGITSLRPSQPVDFALPARPSIAITVAHAQPTSDGPVRDEPNWHTVARRATLLDVAHTRLGASNRWREIWELNRGRVMNDGCRFDRPEVLHRGWRLQLPANIPATDTTATHATPIQPHSPEIHVVRAGDTLSAIIRDDVGQRATGADVRAVFNANRGVTDWRGAHPLRDPNLINPGMRLDLSILDTPGARPTPVPAPSPPPETAPPTPTPRTTTATPPASAGPVSTTTPETAPTLEANGSTPTASAQTSPAQTSPAHTSTAPSAPHRSDNTNAEALAGLALLSSAALAVGHALRQRRLRASQPGDRTPRADFVVQRLARRLRTSASNHDGDRLRRALRSLGDVRPQALRTRSDGTIEALLALPVARPPRPWTPSAGGNVAILRANAALPTSDATLPAALVELGTDSEGGAIYVDLEACEGLGIDATGEAFACLARAVVATLCAAPHAGALRVHTLGFDATGIDPVGRVEHHDHDAQLRAAITNRDRDELNIVVTTQPFDTDTVDETTGLVIVGPLPTGPDHRWCLRPAAEDSWRLEPLGTVLRPGALAAGELAELAAYYHHADAALAADPDAPPDDAITEPPAATVTNALVPSDGAVREAWQLMIRVFGSVDIVNRHGETPVTHRRKAIEALVWFVEHREHGHRAAMRSALWSYEPSPDTVQNVVSEARRILRSLAPPPVGEDWFDRALQLHPLVVSDAELVAAALNNAPGQDDAEALVSLEGAVALIRGAPLADVAYLWADGESIPSRLTLLAVRAAAELAELHLARHDADGALRATEVGLRVLPAHEGLVCLRMRAHAAGGDDASVRAEYESYERLVLGDEFSDGEISHEVAGTYRRLAGPRPVRPAS